MGRNLNNRQTTEEQGRPGNPKSGSADNAQLVVTHSAPGAGKRLVVTHCDFDFSAKTVEDKLAEIVEDVGGTPVVLWRGYTDASKGALVEDLAENPIYVTANKTVSARLAASGSGGVLGVANITTITENA